LIFRNVLLPGILIPAMATALVLGFFALLRTDSGRGVAGSSVAAGFVAAFVAISGGPRWPPVEATQRLCFLAVALVLLSLPLARIGGRSARLGIQLALAAVLVGILLQSPVRHSWSPLGSLAWLSGLALWILLLGWALGRSFERSTGRWTAALVRSSVAGAIALSLGLSESLRLGQIAGAVACSLAVVEVAVWISPRRRWSSSDGAVVVIILGGLMIVGYFFSSLQVMPALLLSLSILLLALPDDDRRWTLLAPLAPLILALVLVASAFLAREDGPYEDYYGAFPVRVSEVVRS
jgi:hypothetical protein